MCPTIDSLPVARLAQFVSSSLLAAPGLVGWSLMIRVVSMPVARHDLVTGMTPTEEMSGRNDWPCVGLWWTRDRGRSEGEAKEMAKRLFIEV